METIDFDEKPPIGLGIGKERKRKEKKVFHLGVLSRK